MKKLSRLNKKACFDSRLEFDERIHNKPYQMLGKFYLFNFRVVVFLMLCFLLFALRKYSVINKY